MISGVLWAVSALLVLAGTVALSLDLSALSLALFAHAMLAIGSACVMTARCLLEGQTRQIMNAIDLVEDARRAGIRRLG